jgi:hypothetical protein
VGEGLSGRTCLRRFDDGAFPRSSPPYNKIVSAGTRKVRHEAPRPDILGLAVETLGHFPSASSFLTFRVCRHNSTGGSGSSSGSSSSSSSRH